MVTVIDSIYRIKDMVEAVPTQVMMVAVPVGMAALAAVSAAVAHLVEDWLSSQGRH